MDDVFHTVRNVNMIIETTRHEAHAVAGLIDHMILPQINQSDNIAFLNEAWERSSQLRKAIETRLGELGLKLVKEKKT